MSVFDNTYAGIPGNHAGKTFDKLLELVPNGTVQTDATASAAIEIGTGLIDADLVIEVTLSTGSNAVAIQFSDTADFATTHAGPRQTIPADYTGKVVLPFRNSYANEGPKAFMRVVPTVGTALTIGAFVAKK